MNVYCVASWNDWYICKCIPYIKATACMAEYANIKLEISYTNSEFDSEVNMAVCAMLLTIYCSIYLIGCLASQTHFFLFVWAHTQKENESGS